ncbi:MAG: hypothetical protein QW530_01985 [Candidatus Micrarchaeaceae archaeon]
MIEKIVKNEETKELEYKIKDFTALARLRYAMAGLTAAFGGFLGVISLENALSSNVSDQNVAPFWGAASAVLLIWSIHSLLRGNTNEQKAETLWDELKTKLRKN